MQDDVADIGFCTVFATLRCSIRETHLHVSSLVPGSTGWRGGRHHKDAAIADPAAIAIFVPHWCFDDTHMQEPLLREAFSSYLSVSKNPQFLRPPCAWLLPVNMAI